MTATRPTPRRASSAAPNADALAALSAPAEARRLSKAIPSDPVLGASAPTSGAPAAEPETPDQPRRLGDVKVKAGYYIENSRLKRARAAYANLPASQRPKSFSDFQAAAVMASVEAVERAINGGDAFPGIEAGTLPTGRPMQD
jgi:hypothetical protein